MAYAAYVALSEAVPAFWRLPAKLGGFLRIPGGCRLVAAAISAQFRVPALRVTMDARTTAAVRAVNLVVGQANDAAVAENLRLRCAVERAVVAIEQGDRVVALRLLAIALNQEPVPVPARICA